MADLSRHWPDGLELTRDRLRLRPLRDHAVFKLQIRHNIGAVVAELIGMPPLTGATTSIRTATCAGIAPGEWLVYGPVAAATDVVDEWTAQLAETCHLLADLTHASTVFLVSEADATAALAAHCPLDFSERSFLPGAAARSLFGETHSFIARIVAPEPTFVLIVDQTMARYVVRLLAGPDSAV